MLCGYIVGVFCCRAYYNTTDALADLSESTEL